MEKIYSRPKIKFPKKKYRIIIVLIILATMIVLVLNKVIYPLFSKKCIYKAKVIVTQVSNEET